MEEKVKLSSSYTVERGGTSGYESNLYNHLGPW